MSNLRRDRQPADLPPSRSYPHGPLNDSVPNPDTRPIARIPASVHDWHAGAGFLLILGVALIAGSLALSMPVQRWLGENAIVLAVGVIIVVTYAVLAGEIRRRWL